MSVRLAPVSWARNKRRLNKSRDLRQSMRTSLTCDVPGILREMTAAMNTWRRTVEPQLRELPFEVVNRREKDFHVEDVLLGHLNGFRVLAAARASLNVRYTRCT